VSWEEMSREEYPCDCGKGTYTVALEMDDWNRVRKHRKMHCTECAKRESLKEFQISEERQRRQRLEKEIPAYFFEKYLEDWLSHFASARNKKDAWSIADKLKVENYTLSNFYSINKRRSIEEYVKRLVTPGNMTKIMQALNIDDNDLKNKVEEAEELYRKEYARSVAAWHRDH
jgi:hypothetical protein